MKVILVLVDGMRPDAIAGIPAAKKMIETSCADMKAQTVFPPVTLPCHVSLFHSVDPARHGTTTNTYTPQVRPIDGLCEVLSRNKLRCGFFYNWEQLRDLSRPASLTYSFFCSGKRNGWETANKKVTEAAFENIAGYDLDFAFVYLGWSDEAGHGHGWMSEEYMRALHASWDDITKFYERYGSEYQFIIVADHGGHDRTHGLDIPEDMTIPLILHGSAFCAGKTISGVSIKDVAPTAASLFGVEVPEEWEGKNILEKL